MLGSFPRRDRRIPVMPKESEDPFDLLGIEPAFELDVASLRSVVRRRIAVHHPDRITDPIAQADAVREVARLNQAWAVIENEELRANHLLERMGGPSASEDRSLPPAFLQQMLEVREDMEQALASADPQQRARVEAWASSERARLRSSVADLFIRFGGGEDLGGEIRLQLNEWRYIERMIEQLNPPRVDPHAAPRDT